MLVRLRLQLRVKRVCITTPGYNISNVSRVHYLWITDKPPVALPRNVFVVIRCLTGDAVKRYVYVIIPYASGYGSLIL